MKSISILSVLAFTLLIVSCKPKETSSPKIELTKSQAIAQDVMIAMGGQQKWDDLQYVSWTFFGARHLVWDKKNGRVRIDSPRDTSVYLVKLNTKEGKVMRKGVEISDSTLITQIERGKSIWINDAYWLFMPFKLQDEGVHLKYERKDTLPGGKESHVLALTFDNVGNTPENKYEVYIDTNDNLIKQWAFFKEANQETPPRIWPWDNYQNHNGLLLSSERSDSSGPSNVRVYESLDDAVFESFDAFDYF